MTTIVTGQWAAFATLATCLVSKLYLLLCLIYFVSAEQVVLSRVRILKSPLIQWLCSVSTELCGQLCSSCLFLNTECYSIIHICIDCWSDTCPDCKETCTALFSPHAKQPECFIRNLILNAIKRTKNGHRKVYMHPNNLKKKKTKYRRGKDSFQLSTYPMSGCKNSKKKIGDGDQT